MEYGPSEMMVVALAREIREGDLVFHGLASPVPVQAMKLAKEMGKDFTWINITGGVDPDHIVPSYHGSTLSKNQFDGSVAHFGLDEIFDLASSGRVDISFLSFVQIGRKGEINMSYVGGTYDKPKVRLPGGAGSATLTPLTKRTTIWKTKHDRNSLVEKVQFATTTADPGKEFTVVTNLSVFRLKNGQLELDSIFPYTTLEQVKECTGWEITQTDVPFYEPPTREELQILERIDPQRIRNIEF